MNTNLSEGSTLYHEARSAMESRDFETAIKKLKKSVELTPHFKTFECLGECFMEQRNYSEAIGYLTKSTELANNQSRPYFLLAKALLEFGEKDKAIDKLEKALKINPNYKAAKELSMKVLDKSD